MNTDRPLGNNQVAQLLGVAQSQPSRWKRGEPIGPENARRTIDLEYVLRRLFTSSLHEDEVTEWLTYPQPYLGGHRPIDTLMVSGVAAILDAIDAMNQEGML